jgi:hypothetical protein
MASGIALVTMLSDHTMRKFITPCFRIVIAALLVLLIVTFIYQIRSSVDKEVITVSVISLVLLIISIALVSHSFLIGSALALGGIMHALYKFVIGGQIFTLGPKMTWFGVAQFYIPNIYEYGALIFGMSVAWLVYSLSYRVLNKS